MISNFINIVVNCNPYTMFVRTKQRFGVKRVLLCFENENEELNCDYEKFDLLEIDTRFCALVDASIYCQLLRP